jgi:hypothetical protein
VVFIPTKVINLAYGMRKHTIRSQKVVWIDRTGVAEGQRSVFANWQKRSPCTITSLLALLILIWNIIGAGKLHDADSIARFQILGYLLL